MSAATPAHRNSGKWVILAVFLISCGLILPLSWQAIQAERRQSLLMNNMKNSLVAIDKLLHQPDCVASDLIAASALFVRQTRTIDATFPRLSVPGSEFAKLSAALNIESARFAANSDRTSCQSGQLTVRALKNKCGACHKAFAAGARDPWPTVAPIR